MVGRRAPTTSFGAAARRYARMQTTTDAVVVSMFNQLSGPVVFEPKLFAIVDEEYGMAGRAVSPVRAQLE